MINNRMLPIRLIITTNCNGSCYFCHKEGVESNQDMPLNTIMHCANIAKYFSAPMSITGGEPTLRKDLDVIINTIYDVAPNINLGLTTNGFHLFDFYDIQTPINTLNLSITSFDNTISQKYQKVSPVKALSALKTFPAINKNLNVVIVEDNYLEIDDFIEYCVKNNYNLDLMFELKSYTEKEIKIQQYILNKIERIGNIRLVIKPSPILEIDTGKLVKIRIKHPSLSSIPEFHFCKNCNESSDCFERICSFRVYPDGQVSPCLKRKFKINDKYFEEELIKIYQEVHSSISLLSFITKD